MTAGKRIAIARKDRGLTQKELGKLSGTSEITIRQYEIGKREPGAKQLRSIAEVLDVSSDYILGLSDVKTTSTELKNICNYTGLSEKALFVLCAAKESQISHVFEKSIIGLQEIVCDIVTASPSPAPAETSASASD